MKILVSACLLGECCKYDGGSNRSDTVCRLRDEHELVPVCPECLGGLPTPRPPAEIVAWSSEQVDCATRSKQAEPANLAESETPVELANLADRATPVEPANRATPATPATPVNRADRATPATPANCATPASLADSAATIESATPATPADSVKLAEAANSVTSACIVKRAERIVNRNGEDVTVQFLAGAQAALELARQEHVELAVLQPRSPSCGVREVYDGTFSSTLIPGRGVFAELLASEGIPAIEPHDLPIAK